MTNHPNRNWRSRWTVDLEKREARHIDGWAFRFDRTDDDPRAWDGKCVSIPADMEMDASAISRICREAGDIFVEVRNKKNTLRLVPSG